MSDKPPIGVNRLRRGRVFVNEDALCVDAAAASAFMSRIVVVKCDYNPCTLQLEYWGYSDDFDVCHPGLVVPEYEVIFTRSDGVPVSVEFRKREVGK